MRLVKMLRGFLHTLPSGSKKEGDCRGDMEGGKGFKALKLGLSLKKFQQRGLCPDLIPGVKREQETLDSVFDSRRKEMKTPFTTLHTKGETK